jgi:hypothetical protein
MDVQLGALLTFTMSTDDSGISSHPLTHSISSQGTLQSIGQTTIPFPSTVQFAHVLLPQCAVRSDVHSLLDLYRIFFLPSVEILRLLESCLLECVHWKERTQQDLSPWSQLRKGSLKGYEDLMARGPNTPSSCSPHFHDQHDISTFDNGA